VSTIHETIDYLERRVYEFAHLGAVDLENGARLVGHIPHVAEYGYLNCLGYPLETQKILELEKQFLITFDADLTEFFKKYNGLSLYNGAFAFYGKHGEFSRTSGWLNFEPFEISMPNTVERIRDALST
jgi:hypothetical protein